MQTVILSCAFGVVCTMILWVLISASAKRDQLLRRGGGKLFRPEEL